MKCYEIILSELIEGNEPKGSSDQQLDIGVIEEDSSKMVFMPRVYCSICHTRYVQGIGFPVPEVENLPQKHPLIVRIRRMANAYDEALKRINQDLITLLNSQVGNPLPEDDLIWQRFNEEGAASPAEFAPLADALRATNIVSPARELYPYARLGAKQIKIYHDDLADFVNELILSSSLIVDERVPKLLHHAGITGWMDYPIKVRDSRRRKVEQLPILRELLVTGRGGIPSADSASFQYTTCTACGFSTYDLFPDRVVLDQAQWDGTDMFCFRDHPSVFITERGKHAIEAARLSGIMFRPSDVPKDEWQVQAGMLSEIV